jgi:hypothetical protein
MSERAKYITLKQLKTNRACLPEQRRFKHLFGERVRVTVGNCMALSQVFNFRWAASMLLTYKQHEIYVAHLKDYESFSDYMGRMIALLSSTVSNDHLPSEIESALWEDWWGIKNLKTAEAFGHAYLSPKK